jgi:hypothetical protein
MSQLVGRPFVALSAFLALLAFLESAGAAERGNEVFTVRNVTVDTTAATAAAARDTALVGAERNAFQRLLARLTLASDAKRLPKLTAADLADLTEGFEVQEEKHSAVRYIASLTYRFKPPQVEKLLQDAGIPFAQTPSKPVLVLALLRAGDKLSLWEDPNPWRTTWATLPPADGLVPFVVPVGDLTDFAAIGAGEASTGDAQKLAAMAQRYEAGSTLVVTAVIRGKPDGSPKAVELASSRFVPGSDSQVTISSVAALKGETLDALLARAAQQIESDIGEKWKADNLIHFDQAQEAVVTVPIANLENWLAVEARLAQVASIKRTALIFLSRSEAQIAVQFFGDPAQLKLALAQRDLILTGEGEGLVLRLASSEAVGASAAGAAAETDITPR